jgi:hypothetical protein
MVSAGQGGINNWIPVTENFPAVMRASPTGVIAFGGVGTSGFNIQVTSSEGGFYAYAISPQPIGTMTSFTYTASAEL